MGDDQIDIFGDNKNPPSGNCIFGEAGDDTIVGGAGNDIFVYEGGSNFIDDC